MSEVTKLYENAGVELNEGLEWVCQNPDHCAYQNLSVTPENCIGCEHFEREMRFPPFTAEKQIELFKWLIQKYKDIEKIMAQEIIYLTAEGYKRLKDELDHMRSVERPAAAAAIAEARDKGDLSENAEYDAAREAQGMLEMKIAQMEATLTNARIIDETKIDKSKVQILSKVTLLNHNNKREVTYTIVAEHEANLREGKLAIGTPIAKALLGKKKGDVVEVTVPAGVLKFEILDISI